MKILLAHTKPQRLSSLGFPKMRRQLWLRPRLGTPPTRLHKIMPALVQFLLSSIPSHKLQKEHESPSVVVGATFP
jgi:hypothetical protein